MQKIRAEKEFVVHWSGILTNGEPESLEGRDLTLYLINPYGPATAQDIEVENNNITARISAGTCNVLGQYRLKLYENKDKAHGGKWDWIDWGMTIAGVIVGFGLKWMLWM